MNLPSDENTLQLFKYIPDVTSQFLVQNNESQELVIPNICDDLLSSLDNTPGWTLGGFPVVLNAPVVTSDQPSTIFLNSLTSSVDSTLETDNILELNENVINSTDFPEAESAENELLLKPPSRIITEDGLFTSESLEVPVENPPIVTTAAIEPNVEETEEQSDETPASFIDINGMLIPESTIIKLSNNDIIYNVQEAQRSVLKINNKKCVKRKLSNKKTKRKKFKNDVSLNINNTPHLNGLIEICDENNVTTLVDVNTVINNPLLLTTDHIINTNENATETETEDSLIVKNEPDSTINEDYINIDDLAEVITAYKCKKCDFAYNNQEQFLQHFKKTHAQVENFHEPIVNIEEIDVEDGSSKEETNINVSDTSQIDDDVQSDIHSETNSTLQLVYNSNNIPVTNFTDNDIGKKIMRIKRKKIKKPRKEYHEIREDHSITFTATKNDKIYEEPLKIETIENIDEEESDTEPIEIYLCSECASHFDTVEEVRNHMINVHNCKSVDEKDPFKPSEHTEASPQSIESIEPTEEMRKRNQNAINKFLTTDIIKARKHKCTVKNCHNRFAKTELLERHIACHIENARNQYKCYECEQEFLGWKNCTLHLWNIHQIDLDLYSCPLCDYKGSTKMKLRNHLKIHSEDREYSCPDCGRSFKQASQMRNHRVIHLDKEIHDIPKWYAQKHCDKCDKDFADAKCLKKHIQAVHSKLKPFICNVCGHSCARKAMLQMHLRQHTGEKPYACKLCYYRTGDHNSLRRHMMRHSGERPYKCPHCEYQAIQSNSYKNHLASKHPGKGGAYSCTYCNFNTVNEESYVGHIKDHKKGLLECNKKEEIKEKTGTMRNTNILYNYTDSNSNSNNNETCDFKDTHNQDQHFVLEAEDEETQHFLTLGDLNDEQTVDTGGITIPADP